MESVAVVLVLVSAGMHATWNMLAKRSSEPIAFLFAINLATLIYFAIPAAYIAYRNPVPPDAWIFVALTGILNTFYVIFLGLSYTHGALTVVYPVARGTGVLLVPLLAIPIFGEQPTGIAFLGIGAILAGLILIGFEGLRFTSSHDVRSSLRALVLPFITGLFIASYSLVDNAGVARVHPLVYSYLLFLLMTVGMLPYVLLRRRGGVRRAWARHRSTVLIGGLLLISTYAIVLGALRLANVGYVVPLRETSIVFSAILGTVFLGEIISRLRVAAVILIVAGTLAIAFGG